MTKGEAPCVRIVAPSKCSVIDFIGENWVCFAKKKLFPSGAKQDHSVWPGPDLAPVPGKQRRTVETKTRFGGRWDLDAVFGPAGRAVRDRSHNHDGVPFRVPNRQNNDCGSGFGAGVTALLVFSPPEIGVRDDHARLWWGDGQAPSFRIRRSDGHIQQELRPS